MQTLADELKIEIRIAHYPPDTSKYNPIEHRLFPHITRACEGIIFKSIALVNEVISKTSTSTGFTVFTSILDRTFETGRKVAHDFKENLKIQFDEWLPQWNYVAVPSMTEVSGVIKSWVLTRELHQIEVTLGLEDLGGLDSLNFSLLRTLQVVFLFSFPHVCVKMAGNYATSCK